MRRLVTISAQMALLWASPIPLLAAERPQARPADTGTIVGQARDASGQPLPSSRLRLRDMRTGAVVAETTADNEAAFTFATIATVTAVVVVQKTASASR